jgi:CheY-like chemotaxis protein
VHPFLLLLDIEMPTPDGLAVCRALKADPATSCGYIWICIGSRDVAALSAEASADGYLRKPFRLGDLVARVKDYARVP